MDYPQQGNSSKGIMVMFMVVVILGLLFVFLGDKVALTRGMHDRMFSGGLFHSDRPDTDYAQQLVLPPASVDQWCKIQEVTISADIEQPIRNRIIGWDAINKACVSEYTGHSGCLNGSVVVLYAYTAVVGGEVKWVMADGVYRAAADYVDYIDDLDKEYIKNKPCKEGLY